MKMEIDECIRDVNSGKRTFYDPTFYDDDPWSDDSMEERGAQIVLCGPVKCSKVATHAYRFVKRAYRPEIYHLGYRVEYVSQRAGLAIEWDNRAPKTASVAPAPAKAVTATVPSTGNNTSQKRRFVSSGIAARVAMFGG